MLLRGFKEKKEVLNIDNCMGITVKINVHVFIESYLHRIHS